MNKRILLSIVVACVLLAVVSLPMFSTTPRSWVSFDGSARESKPSIIVQSSNEFETVVEIELEGVLVNEVVENGETYHVLCFPYYGTTLEIGKPQLPIIKEMIGIPGDADVSVSVTVQKEMTLTGYRVHPFQRPLLETEKRVEFDIDEDFYASDILYPEKIVDVDKPAIWRDVRLVNLCVRPIRYNPATGELIVCQKLTVTLAYEGKSAENVHDYGDRIVSQAYDELYSNTILNYDYLNLQVRDPLEYGPAQHYHLLIIAVDRFIDELAPLETWKETQGIVTEIHPLTNIVPPTDVNIKSYITQEYNDHDIDYVLLVGDIIELPIYRGYTYAYGTIISDYWYALLVGDDLDPEVAVGRFSSTDEEEITNMVNKTINFEDGPPSLWHDDVLLVAHKQSAPGRYQRCKEDIRNATDTQSGTYRVMHPNFRTEYGALLAQGGNDARNADVIASINEGRVIVNYRGHGGRTEWSRWNSVEEDFTNTEVGALNNGEMTPVVFGIACFNNDLDWATNCIGEAFTKPDDAAVAYLGASRPSWTLANHTYDKQLFAAIYDEGTRAIGHASNVAALRMRRDHGSYGEDNAKMYLWLGDPSLAMPYEDPRITYYWLLLFDKTGSMGSGERMQRAKTYARNRVTDILNDPDDQIALASFAETFTVDIDWTRDEQALHDAIDAYTSGGMTALADAVCAAVDKHLADGTPPGTRRVILVTDGGENWSSGPCSGPADPTPNPPWCDSPTSWHCLALTAMLDNAICDIAYFGNVGGVSAGSGDDVTTNASEEEEFLADLAGTSGGEYFDPDLACGNGVLEPGEQCDVGYPCRLGQVLPRYDCINCQCYPTAISLASFTAEYLEDMVAISWTTAAETDNAGFNVHRGLDDQGPVAKVNEELIASAGSELYETSYTLYDNDIVPGMTYYYWLEDINVRGDVTMHGPISVEAAMDDHGAGAAAPVSFTLSQNYPNPFNPVTDIMYDLPVDCDVVLEIYNVLGQKVITLVNDNQNAGSRIVTWNGRNEEGVPVSSGIYFYRIQAGTFIEVKKMVLMR